MADEVSREDFDSVVRAVSDVVSGFRPGLSLLSENELRKLSRRCAVRGTVYAEDGPAV